ncbi:hypothetical protein SDC9_141852 [bioreactor metagenome]|uniref:Uncharacterized protein n=1 Tax=bioreactor metagenome TaxID=1076179 RepID=A0A645DYV8_9ZZZZ
MRSSDRFRRPFRRPGDRQSGPFRGRCQNHPRRHRPVGDQQEQDRHAGCGGQYQRGADRAQPRSDLQGIQGMVRADRRMEGKISADLPGETRPCPTAIRGGTARSDDQRRCRDRAGRGPAPDVGNPVLSLQAPPPVAEFGRSRGDGLRAAGGDGRQSGAALCDGDQHRWRRQFPDEHPGTGHALRRIDQREDGDPEQSAPRHGGAVGRPLLRQLPRQYRARQPEGRRLLPGFRDHRQGLRHSRAGGPDPGRAARRHPRNA